MNGFQTKLKASIKDLVPVEWWKYRNLFPRFFSAFLLIHFILWKWIMPGIEPYSCETDLNAQWEMSFCKHSLCFVHKFFLLLFQLPNAHITKLRYEGGNMKPCCGEHHTLLLCHNNWTGEKRIANYEKNNKKQMCINSEFLREKKAKPKFRNYKYSNTFPAIARNAKLSYQIALRLYFWPHLYWFIHNCICVRLVWVCLRCFCVICVNYYY